MAQYMKTGVTVTCSQCGAMGVPMGWGSGPDGSVRLYRHAAGMAFKAGGNRGVPPCSGPEDLFADLLDRAGLAVEVQGDEGAKAYPDHEMLF